MPGSRSVAGKDIKGRLQSRSRPRYDALPPRDRRRCALSKRGGALKQELLAASARGRRSVLMPINSEGAEQSAGFGRVIARRPSSAADFTGVFLRRERRRMASLNRAEVKMADTAGKIALLWSRPISFRRPRRTKLLTVDQ